jgi:hypothetical protein
MAKLAEPTGELARLLELIATARTVTSVNHDLDLIEKITMLQEYAEFSTMFPNRDYGPVLRKGAAELSAILENILESEESAGVSRTGVVRLSLSPRGTATD